MYTKYIFYSSLINYVTSGVPKSIYQSINDETPNIYTIQSNQYPLNNIYEYTDSELELLQIKTEPTVDIFSLFTKNYFSRCDRDNDPNCEYNLKEQETACKQYMDDNQNNNTYKMYYYGVSNNYNHNRNKLNYIILHDHVKEIKYNLKYKTIGIYVIENINNTHIESYLYKLNISILEPDDFYRRMMLYIIPGYNNKTTFCPYWTIRNS